MDARITGFKDRIRSKFVHFRASFQAYMNRTFESPRRTFVFLGLFVFTTLFLIQTLIILTRNSFYNNFSDDIIQYYSIMCDFIAQIKAGTMSFFNLNNYLGASFFSDVYYIPLDGFTGITFLLSYVFPTELAYSTTELIKIWSGVMMFAWYLHLSGMKTRTVFWMGIVYFISGGSVSFMAFPVFLSLAFYLPASLVVIHFFARGKRWIVPLFTMALVFYDFYLGYSAMAFMSILYVVEAFKRPGFRIGPFIRDGVIFLSLILLGVAMAGIILYPSMLYILEDTYRTTASFNAWVVTIFGKEFRLFQPEIYFRILAKIFTEQKGIGFYGFENHYGLEHVSLYITAVGAAFMPYVYFMKGRVARVYKLLIPFGLVLIVFPIFSYVFSGTTDSPYTRWINMIPIVQTMILAHVFDAHGFETEKMHWLTIPLVLLLALDGYMIYYYIDKLSIDTYYASRDILTADTVLMCVAAVFLLLVLIFGWMGKRRWIRTVFWVEFAVAIAYIYSGPFSIPNKIDTFESMHSIDAFLEANLDHDEFFRVYVDLARFDVEQLNFNRMTSFPTNTKIFHSWTDAETNMIGYLLFAANEYQSKDKLSVQALYLNHVLGYKYVLVSAAKDYYLDNAYYTPIAADAEYRLYEIADAEPFQVYESYMTYGDFRNYAAINNRIAAQKLLLMNVLLDEERYDVDAFVLTESDPADGDALRTLNAYRYSSVATEVQAPGIVDPTPRSFFRYDETSLGIDFSAGAAYLNVLSLTPLDYGEVYMEFANGSIDACDVVHGLTHQVKCEFWLEPVALYFEKTTGFNTAKNLQYRLERALDGAAYLVYDFSAVIFPEDAGMLYFQMTNSMTFERVFAVDDEGHETECFEGYVYFDHAPKRLYVFKTNDMYDYSNPFNLALKYVFDDLSDYATNADSPLAADEWMSISFGRIQLSYTRTSTSLNDQIVMVPVAYSEEWVVTSDIAYETLAVSGGFLGIVVPAGSTDISVSLQFIPKGILRGALTLAPTDEGGILGTTIVYDPEGRFSGLALTMSGVALYAILFLLPDVIRRIGRNRIRAKKEVLTDEATRDHRPIL